MSDPVDSSGILRRMTRFVVGRRVFEVDVG
jgi:hypothetical protein